jgi:alkanesulfonate monooxygenase SsuD/methylene tetrahydromethanopterin reductase-like flavin-dependent oxidoreductase (luciferase family)
MTVSIGVVLPEAVPPGAPLPDIAGLAALAERAGLDCLWSGDSLALGQHSVLDNSLTLAAAAAVTETIGIGFAIYVPALRPLVWAAKQVATLQHISAGRLVLGVGLGGEEEQFRLAGFRAADRARRTNDFLGLLPAALAGKPVMFPDATADAGAAPAAVELRPAAPMPPVWIGGSSPAALRRAVGFGDGWLTGFQTPAEFAASARQLRNLAAEAGRPAPRAGLCLHVAIAARPSAGLAEMSAAVMHASYGVPMDRARQLVIAGSPGQVADQLARYVSAGAELFALVCDPAPGPEVWQLAAEVRIRLRVPKA